MEVTVLFYVLAGCFLGLITGLLPGLHANTVALIAVSFASAGNAEIAALIIAMSVVHSFTDFIPSIFLGAPDNESFLSVLPGHRYLLKGKAFRALMLTVAGGLIGGISAVIASPLFFFLVQENFQSINFIIPWALILVVILMILSEKGFEKKMNSLIIISLSALLGYLVLHKLSVQNPLFALVTGFFGISTMVYSIGKKPLIPEQKTGKFAVKESVAAKGSFLSVLAGSIVSLTPGIGSGEAAFIAKKFSGKINTSKYLVMLGGINTVNIMFSFFMLYLFEKTRSGAAAAVSQIILLQERHLALIIGTMLFALGFGAIITKIIAGKAPSLIQKIPYVNLNIAVLGLISVLLILLTDLIGIIAALTAAGIGLIAVSSGVRRTQCMAFLIVPTILIYFGI